MFLIFWRFPAINFHGNYEGRGLKFAKMVIVAAAAVMALAGTASASTLTSPEGTTYTGEIVATSGVMTLEMSFMTSQCTSSETRLKVQQHGAVNVSGAVTAFSFSGCNFPTTINKNGRLEVDSSGTVISTGAEISIQTAYGACVLTTSRTAISSLTGGSFAVMDINSAKIPRTGGTFLCGTHWVWTGGYTVSKPSSLVVD